MSRKNEPQFKNQYRVVVTCSHDPIRPIGTEGQLRRELCHRGFV
jgi:hypothetical protein